MKRSCKYCGFIHEVGFNCPSKPKRKQKDREEDVFRNTYIWQKKREEIKERDLYLCVACRDENINGKIKYNFDDLEVHHIVPLKEDYSLRLENDNLITLCNNHHRDAESGAIKADYLKSLISR